MAIMQIKAELGFLKLIVAGLLKGAMLEHASGMSNYDREKKSDFSDPSLRPYTGLPPR
jgi:hypothetical protein